MSFTLVWAIFTVCCLINIGGSFSEAQHLNYSNTEVIQIFTKNVPAPVYSDESTLSSLSGDEEAVINTTVLSEYSSEAKPGTSVRRENPDETTTETMSVNKSENNPKISFLYKNTSSEPVTFELKHFNKTNIHFDVFLKKEVEKYEHSNSSVGDTLLAFLVILIVVVLLNFVYLSTIGYLQTRSRRRNRSQRSENTEQPDPPVNITGCCVKVAAGDLD